MRLRILFGDFNAEQAVACGNIQHAQRAAVSFEHQCAERRGQRGHHGRHCLGKQNPNRILRLHGAVARQRGATVAHHFGQMLVRLAQLRCAQELRNGCHAGRGARIKKRGAARGVLVAPVLL